MKLKIVLTAVFLGIFSCLMLSQLKVVTAAQSGAKPLTDPITRPITYFKIGGNILSPSSLYTARVTITARNLDTQEQTRYDVKGNSYSFPLPMGPYQVKASDAIG